MGSLAPPIDSVAKAACQKWLTQPLLYSETASQLCNFKYEFLCLWVFTTAIVPYLSSSEHPAGPVLWNQTRQPSRRFSDILMLLNLEKEQITFLIREHFSAGIPSAEGTSGLVTKMLQPISADVLHLQ